MEKTGKDHIVCVKCSREAIPGTNPPVCMEHSKLEKKAEEEPKTIREFADNPGDKFNG